MKNKKVILLIALVICIWGTIAKKIYDGMQDAEELRSMPEITEISLNEPLEDDYPLVLTYNDPFLKTPTVANPRLPVLSKKKPLPAVQMSPVRSVDWNRFQYLGSVHNGSRNSMIASVRVGAAEYMVRPGDIIEEFKIEAVSKDSIQLSCGTQFRYIKKMK